MQCPICKSIKINLKYKVKRDDVKRDLEYKIWECCHCGFCWAEGPFSTNLLKNIYNDHFFLTSQQSSYHSYSPIVLNAKKRAEKINKIVKNGPLLDIGTGKGYFVREFRKFHNADGIDLSKYAVDEAKNERVNLILGDFMKYNFKKKYNVITLWDVFACFSKPVPTLKRAQSLLNKNGYLVLTVPMINSPLAKLFGKRWPLMIPPTNMVFFTPKSVELLLKKCGFKIIESSYEAKWISIDFMVRKLLKSLGLINLASKKIPIPKRFMIPYKSRDILTITAQKI